MNIPDHITKRKHSIEKEFKMLEVKNASINVVPELPDHLNIIVSRGISRKEKSIHFNEDSQLGKMLRFHGVV